MRHFSIRWHITKGSQCWDTSRGHNWTHNRTAPVPNVFWSDEPCYISLVYAPTHAGEQLTLRYSLYNINNYKVSCKVWLINCITYRQWQQLSLPSDSTHPGRWVIVQLFYCMWWKHSNLAKVSLTKLLHQRHCVIIVLPEITERHKRFGSMSKQVFVPDTFRRILQWKYTYCNLYVYTGCSLAHGTNFDSLYINPKITLFQE